MTGLQILLLVGAALLCIIAGALIEANNGFVRRFTNIGKAVKKELGE